MARRQKRIKEEQEMLFSALNYKLLALGILLVVTGFTAMYLEMEVYGFISLYVAPVVIMSGYITVIFAILKRESEADTHQTQSS
jgi:uncharacterized membrane protein HdeD (DUF308 family)